MLQPSPYAYRMYRMVSPVDTHYRKATCAEFQCNEYLNGWPLQVEQLSEEQLYLAKHSGRQYTNVHIGPGLNFLMFEAGQPCFLADTHRIKLDRPEFFYTGRGDRSVFRQGDARKLNAEDWRDHLMHHIDRLHTKKTRS